MGKLVSYHLSENSYHLKKNSPVIRHKAPFLLRECKLVSYRLRERVSPVIQGKSCPLSHKGKLLSCPLKVGCPPALELHSLSGTSFCHLCEAPSSQPPSSQPPSRSFPAQPALSPQGSTGSFPRTPGRCLILTSRTKETNSPYPSFFSAI